MKVQLSQFGCGRKKLVFKTCKICVSDIENTTFGE